MISGLPDEILVEILLRLTFKQAIATSILSKRWRYLWTYTTSNLIFDAGKRLCDPVFDWPSFDGDEEALAFYTDRGVQGKIW